jgi:protocadherin Fat 1/2/3
MAVTVLDANDHRPQFSERSYSAEVSESVAVGTTVAQLRASDADADGRVFFSLHAARNPSSLRTFRIDSVTGAVTLAERLDRETVDEHQLVVMVKDQGTPSKRNYARLTLKVHDHNDHAPTFAESLMQVRVFETSAVGTLVAQLQAIDLDRGEHARVSYAITSGEWSRLRRLMRSSTALSRFSRGEAGAQNAQTRGAQGATTWS